MFYALAERHFPVILLLSFASMHHGFSAVLFVKAAEEYLNTFKLVIIYLK